MDQGFPIETRQDLAVPASSDLTAIVLYAAVVIAILGTVSFLLDYGLGRL